MGLSKSSNIESIANAKVVARVEGEVVREIKGLEYGGEFKVCCMGCDQELLTLMKISDKPTRFPIGGGNYAEVASQRFRAKCPFCQEMSWIVKVEGQFMVGEVEGKTSIIDYEYGDYNDPEGMMVNPIVEKR